MKPLGKAMKIAHQTGKSEKEALRNLLANHRDTPHPATSLPPGSMLFRDGYKSSFPRKAVSEDDIQKARKRDKEAKIQRDATINASKYHHDSNICIGDSVLIRNHERKSKFDPLFPLVLYEVIQKEGKTVTVRRGKDGKIFKRHPNDVKVTSWRPKEQHTLVKELDEREQLMKFHQIFESIRDDDNENGLSLFERENTVGSTNAINDADACSPRRSSRIRRPNPRYYNEALENG